MAGQTTSVRISFDEFDTPATRKVLNKTLSPSARFQKAALAQIKKLQAGETGTGTDWFRVLPSGEVDQVVVRNGITTMTLGNLEKRKLQNRDMAVQFFQKAIQAANGGMLDEQFELTRKVK